MCMYIRTTDNSGMLTTGEICLPQERSHHYIIQYQMLFLSEAITTVHFVFSTETVQHSLYNTVRSSVGLIACMHVLCPLLICIQSAILLCLLCGLCAFLTAASIALRHWIGCDKMMWHVQILMTQQTANYPLAKYSLLLVNGLWNSVIGNLGFAIFQHSRCCCV